MRRHSLLLAVLLAACLQPLRPQPPPGNELHQDVTIRSSITPDEFGFEPSSLTVRANAPLRLTFDNRLRPGNSGGALAHDFTIDNIPGWGLLSRLAGYRVHIAATPDSAATGDFQLPVGTYAFYCSVDRHALDGMVGTLIVGE